MFPKVFHGLTDEKVVIRETASKDGEKTVKGNPTRRCGVCGGGDKKSTPLDGYMGPRRAKLNPGESVQRALHRICSGTLKFFGEGEDMVGDV